MPNLIVNMPLYFTGITISLIYIYIYTELAPKLSATASVAVFDCNVTGYRLIDVELLGEKEERGSKKGTDNSI